MLGKKKLQRKNFFEKSIETKEMEASWTITLSNQFAKKKKKNKKKKHNTVQERNTIHFLEKSWTPTITITHYTITLEYFFFQIKKYLFMNSKTMRMKLRSYKMWGMSNRSIFAMS